jgi:hypothetical protein
MLIYDIYMFKINVKTATGLECVGQSFAYAHFIFLKGVWIRTHAESCRSKQARFTKLATISAAPEIGGPLLL